MSFLNNQIYKTIANKYKKPPKLVTKTANPKAKDYKKGYITRYFARQTNDENASIIEINSKLAGKIRSNEPGFYTLVQLHWKLTGDLNSKVVNGIKIVGVQEANRNSIAEAEKTLPNLSLVLGSLVQFYKPSAGQTTKGFGDDLGFDNFDPDSGGSTNPGGNTNTSGGGGSY